MDASTKFRLEMLEDAIAQNQDPADADHLARLVAYREKLAAGHDDVARPSHDVGELTPNGFTGGGTKSTGRSQQPDDATANQIRFIARLLAERDPKFAGFGQVFSTFIQRFHNDTLNKRDASELIDWLQDQPMRATAPSSTDTDRRLASERQLAMVNAKRAGKGLQQLAEGTLFADEVDEELAMIAATPDRQFKATVGPDELEAGMYRKDGVIYKVQKAVHGSGRMYAKQLVVEEGEGGGHEIHFEYATGAIRQLRPEHRMSLEEAKQFGALYGTCCVCGRTLTDETSIAEGIGPICKNKV